MTIPPWSVQELVPHTGDKVLLERILDAEQDSLTAEAIIKRSSPYLKGNAEPSWMGLEYMAQAVAAFAGLRGRKQGQAPKVGMLIGTRRYQCSVPEFPVGMVLVIHTNVLLEDENGLSVFQCSIRVGDIIAEANLNVYQPHDIHQYLSSVASA